MPTPSFAQLFRRSRHTRFAGSAEDAQNQERQEIFAVAAVGFALKHDLAFKTKLLRDFAGIEGDVQNYTPLLQDSNCADLALKNEVTQTLVVFEFKVCADLEAHQNPWFNNVKPSDNKSFWENGYGYELQQKRYTAFSTIYYIVVCQDHDKPTGDDCMCSRPGKTFRLKIRSWKKLLDPKTDLEIDLVTSLGDLGIEELKDYKMKTIQIADAQLKNFFQGKDALELLEYIATQKLDLPKGKARNDLIGLCTELSNGPLRQLGVEIPESKMGVLGGIRSSLKTAEYGYYSQNNELFRAEVRFYGDDPKRVNLRELIERELKTEAEFEMDEGALRVVRSNSTSLKDLEWFCKVLGVK